ncbi:Zn(II)2Cys6 transcription factor [Aspergillus mulundensis]|uniref:C6 zinc finger protein n=1 Tax=Aspergillus mulundensis TaxID=1810919 RepID=A0A3D8QMX7_9EURO|nr:C6 zinc finger protein [Aspergillus mulundensis]RDW63186.1 C6 zinc finger protein [Aspergillus mulundensis]
MSRVPKTKTFAGCWTCRRRKVKCDNRRPQCKRCGTSCEGYDVELYWMHGEDERPCAVKRKAMVIHDSQLPVEADLSEVDRMLVEIDEMVAGLGGGAGPCIIGPFSAFAVDGPQPTADKPVALSIDTMMSGLSFFTDLNAAKLLDNYIHVVADLLQPARHTHNPYRSLYVPKAMEAAAGIFVGIGGSPSRLRTALFHALLAVSAFHMHRRRPSTMHYKNEGRLHRLRAIESLKRSFADAEVVSDCPTALSAMLSMVSIDLMEGSMTDFWIHLDGCKKLRFLLPKQGNNQLRTICSFMSTLSRSTDPWLPPKPWKQQENSPFLPDDSNLECTYGITATLASYMDLVIRLSQHLRYYHTNDLPLPPPLEHAISTLHSALISWSIAKEPLMSVAEGDAETFSLVQCHILAFHAGIVIYFYTVTGWTRTPDSRSILCHYNNICVTNLLSAEALKTTYGSQAGWNAMAPIVWPGFIAACEAVPEERPLWRIWWVGVQRYRIGSIEVLWEVVQEVWDIDENSSDANEPRWMSVLRRNGRRVMSGG